MKDNKAALDALKKFLSSNPHPVTEMEKDGLCGLEGEGFVAEGNDDFTYVADLVDDELTLQRHHNPSDGFDIFTFHLDIKCS